MKNSLMGALAGDFGVDFAPGLGMHFNMRKLSHLGGDRLKTRIEEAYFEGPDGQRFTALKGGLWPFLLSLDLDEHLRETETNLHWSFVVQKQSSLQWAHRGFPALFSRPRQAMNPRGPRWRQLLEEHSFPARPDDLRAAAEEAAAYGAVQKFLHLQPQKTPPYLEPGGGNRGAASNKSMQQTGLVGS